MEIEEEPRALYYRNLVHHARLFLTEVDHQSSSSVTRSPSPSSSISVSKSVSSSNVDEQLALTRQHCHDRLLTCARKKFRLLSLQEQNDKRHRTFQKFIDNLDEKRCANIRRYQLELKDYLFKRLEADRLHEQVDLLETKLAQLQVKKNRYSRVLDIVQRAIPLFPVGSLQPGADGVKSLVSRYQTLFETKNALDQRDFSKEKLKRRQEVQRLTLESNTRIAKLSTRIAQLHDRLNDIQTRKSMKEEEILRQADARRSTETILRELVASIDYLYDRYRLSYQIKTDRPETMTRKLRTIQELILYRMDLVQRAK